MARVRTLTPDRNRGGTKWWLKNAFNNHDQLRVADPDQDVAEGSIDGAGFDFKFGENPDTDAGDDVWDGAKPYVFSTSNDITHIASSSAADDTQEIGIVGLKQEDDGETWTEVTQYVTLNGQTPVTLETPLIRCYRAWNNADTGGDLAGDVSIAVGDAFTNGVPSDLDNLRAKIRIGEGQTLMAVYTVPSGKTAYFYDAFVGVITDGVQAETATAQLRARLYGKVFRTRGKIGVVTTGNSTFQKRWKYGLPMPEKPDVKITIPEVSQTGMDIYSAWEVEIHENE